MYCESFDIPTKVMNSSHWPHSDYGTANTLRSLNNYMLQSLSGDRSIIIGRSWHTYPQLWCSQKALYSCKPVAILTVTISLYSSASCEANKIRLVFHYAIGEQVYRIGGFEQKWNNNWSESDRLQGFLSQEHRPKMVNFYSGWSRKFLSA